MLNLKKGKMVRATQHSGCYDLYYPEDYVPISIAPGELTLVRLGIWCQFDPSLVALFREKSGLALKGIEVKAGTIDADYPDEWCLLLKNDSQVAFQILPNMKLAQVLFVQYYVFSELQNLQVERTGGFGSTGK